MSKTTGIQPIAKHGKVLIVDDEEDLRETVKLILESKGINVETAENGKAGLVALENEKFDMILSDLSMPIMTGLEFLENLRARNDSTPFVFYSAFYEKKLLDQAMRLEAFDFLAKPVTPDQLLLAVDNAALVGVLQRKIAYIQEQNNPTLSAFIAEYEGQITKLCLQNYLSDSDKR